MDEIKRRAYLATMGITVWERRIKPTANLEINTMNHSQFNNSKSAKILQFPIFTSEQEISQAVTTAADITTEISTLDWEQLSQAVTNCRACALHETRTQTVFGVGKRDATLMIIGEAPGAEEDRLGEPFVGRAGQLLTKILAALGFTREQVYIANVLKCRPPGNRDPSSEETNCCNNFLLRQISLVQPKILLATGRIAAQQLLQTEELVGRLRNQWFKFGSTAIPLRVTYHPAYLLRDPSKKANTWEDLIAVKLLLNQLSTK